MKQVNTFWKDFQEVFNNKALNVTNLNKVHQFQGETRLKEKFHCDQSACIAKRCIRV